MLTSLVLTLQAPAAGSLPASLGRAGQALLLRLLDERDPALAAELHAGSGPRPYTVSNLVLGRRRGPNLEVTAGQEGWLRFTGLSEPVSRQLLALVADPPALVELDGFRFKLTDLTTDPAAHPWAGQVHYQDIAAPFLLGSSRPKRSLRLEFASPTTFRSQGRYVPFPLPRLVFGSLFNRWQTFAPIALNPELERFAEEMVDAGGFSLHSHGQPAKQGAGATRVGFTGRVTFSARNRDRYWLNMLHLLAAFAFYSGVGYQTTVGLGQARLAPSRG